MLLRSQSVEGCSLFEHDVLRRRVLGAQRRDTWSKPGYTSRTPAGAKKHEKRAEGNGTSTVPVRRRVLVVPACYSQAKGARCSTKRHLAEGWIDQQQDSSGGEERKENGRRARCFHGPSQAKGARCSSMIFSGEGFSLLNEETLGRRLDIPAGRQRW